ncbi:MAG: hypothetical protein IT529_11300 [Burkholderiales bacterium]|nr:hypothetical protein [Burkholderiales bacterium]
MNDVTRAGDEAAAPPAAGTGSGFAALLRNLRCGLRVALFQRVGRADPVASAEAFAALAVADVALLLALDFAAIGTNGMFNYHELARALMSVPLLLALGLIVARRHPGAPGLLVLPVALMAAGMVLSAVTGLAALAFQYGGRFAGGDYWGLVDPFMLLWWAASVAYAVVSLGGGRPAIRVRNVVAAWLLAVGPAWLMPQGGLWTPRYDDGAPPPGFGGIAEEAAFYAQHDALARALAALEPERPGVADLYVVAAGFYAREDVFMKDVRMIERLFRERFDAGGRTVSLINNPAALPDHPVASLTSLAATLRHVGELMNPEEDVLVLYLSSHGSGDHKLAVDFWPLRLEAIDPPAVKRVLDESGIRWRVVVVSACYSGGFIEPLADERTLVITASSATRQSFGCGVDSDSTFLARALFDEALRRTRSFEAAFEIARRSIAVRERERNYAPSEPRIHVGAEIRAKLAAIERRIGGDRHGGRAGPFLDAPAR